MNDELSTILGRYEELVGKLQEKYGIARDEARCRVEEYKRIVEELKKANRKLVLLQEALRKKGKSAKRSFKGKPPRGKRY